MLIALPDCQQGGNAQRGAALVVGIIHRLVPDVVDNTRMGLLVKMLAKDDL